MIARRIKRRQQRLGALGCAALVLLVSVVAVSNAEPSDKAADAQRVSDEVLARAIPGSTPSVTQSSAGDRLLLKVRLPEGLVTSSGRTSTSDQARFLLADIAWRAEVAASAVIPEAPALVSADVVDAHGGVPPLAQNLWHKELRSSPGEDAARVLTGLDSITPDQARQQVAENLGVLNAGLGSDVRSSTAALVYLGPSPNRFAIAVDVSVNDLAALNDHLGDFLDGLSTGLTGGVRSVIEGLAIRVVDDQERHIASWSLPRIGDGTLFIDRALDATRGRLVTLPFVSRTGGPQLWGSASALAVMSNTAPVATFTARGRSRTYEASYVDCGKPGCPTGRGPDRSRPLTVTAGRRIGITLRNRAAEVTAHLGTRALAVKRVDARHWRIRLPRSAKSRTIEINVDFKSRADASWAIALKFRRSA